VAKLGESGESWGHPTYWQYGRDVLNPEGTRSRTHQMPEIDCRSKPRMSKLPTPESVQVFSLARALRGRAWLCGKDPHSGSPFMSIVR